MTTDIQHQRPTRLVTHGNRLHASAINSVVASAIAVLLAGCGGSGDDAAQPGTPDTSPPVISDEAGQKVLVIDADGISYTALQEALAAGSAPGFSGLEIAPAWTGGRTGTPTEQSTSARPSWASLLTGVWASSHQVRWEQDAKDSLTGETLFSELKTALPASKTALIDNSASNLSALPQAQRQPITNVEDCSADAAALDCVVNRTGSFLQQGYDLTVAHIAAPQATQPSQALGIISNAIAQLREQLALRQASYPKEDWLLLVTTGYGSDRYGSATGAQTVENKTIFIAANQELSSLGSNADTAPADSDALYQHAAITDIAPTALKHLKVESTPGSYTFEGQALQAATTIRNTTGTQGEDMASIDLSWELNATPSAKLTLLRDGQAIAELSPETRTYTDDQLPATEDGLQTYRYTLVAGDAMQSWTAQVDYVKPMQLAPSLTTGLASYYSFDGETPSDALAQSTLKPWDSSADGGSSITDDNFLGKWKAAAWRIDTNKVGANGVAGYTLRQASGDITDNNQFTIGFWLRTTDLCQKSLSNGAPIVSNKNWHSGGNAGITIGLWNGCEIRFNLGGSGRIDNSGNSLSANQWAYIALAINRSAGTFTSYVFDPVKGEQIQSSTFSEALGAKVSGLGNGFSLAEDGTGKYITNENSSGSPRGTLDFNDFALWSRALTQDELTSIYRSGRPLTTLIAP